MGKIVSALDWSESHGVSRRQMDRMRDDDGFPLMSSGRGHEATVDLADAWAWLDSKAKREVETARNRYENERERLAAEQADHVAMKNAATRGKILTVDDFLLVTTPTFIMLKTQLLGMTAGVAQQLCEQFGIPADQVPQVRAMIWRETQETLENAANKVGTIGQSIADSLCDIVSTEAAAEPDSN